MLGTLLNLIHFFMVIFPILIYFIPVKYFKNSLKYIFLILTLTPVQWKLLNDKCALTIATKNVGELKKKTFTEEYFAWLYIPIMNIFGIKNNKDNWDKMVYLHLGVNIFLMWYYLFFIIKRK